MDVGETKEKVQQFMNKIPTDFPVMMDPKGSTVGPWNIRAFPTSFVIDQRGVMRYGYVGGLEWDNDEVIVQLEKLIGE